MNCENGHTFSMEMNQPIPRRCVKCGLSEIRTEMKHFPLVEQIEIKKACYIYKTGYIPEYLLISPKKKEELIISMSQRVQGLEFDDFYFMGMLVLVVSNKGEDYFEVVR